MKTWTVEMRVGDEWCPLSATSRQRLAFTLLFKTEARARHVSMVLTDATDGEYRPREVKATPVGKNAGGPN